MTIAQIKAVVKVDIDTAGIAAALIGVLVFQDL